MPLCRKKARRRSSEYPANSRTSACVKRVGGFAVPTVRMRGVFIVLSTPGGRRGFPIDGGNHSASRRPALGSAADPPPRSLGGGNGEPAHGTESGQGRFDLCRA